MPNILELSLILMLVAVLAVSLFRHWKLPAMLGYLFAGTLIGPYSLGIVPDTPETRHLAEFGVVFLMFSIGLEFSLAEMRRSWRAVVLAGGLQVALTVAAIYIGGMLVQSRDDDTDVGLPLAAEERVELQRRGQTIVLRLPRALVTSPLKMAPV